MDMKKVVFWTQAYNAERTIGRAIESVLKQTYGDFVYYCLDNGSQDATGKIVKEYAGKDPRVVYMYSEENLDNAVFRDLPSVISSYGDGDYFALLDADDEYEPTFIEDMLNLIEKNDLSFACCATQEIIEETGALSNAEFRQVSEDIILEGNSFCELFTVYFQYTCTYRAKLMPVETLKSINYENVTDTYGAGGIFARELFKSSRRVGISKKILHKHYIDPGSIDKQYRPQDIEDNCSLYDNTMDYLRAINGLNEVNCGIVYKNYIASISCIVSAIINSGSLCVFDKMQELKRAFTRRYTIDAISSPCVPQGQYAGLFVSVANWIISQDKKAKRSGIAFWLLTWLNNAIPDKSYFPHIKGALAKSPITAGINIRESYYLREPVSEVIDGELDKALGEISKLAENEIPDEFAEAYLKLAQNVCALLEYVDGYVFFVKQWINYLIEFHRYREAAAELDEMQKILPEDENLKGFRDKIVEALDSGVAIDGSAAENFRKTSIVIVFYNNLEYNKMCISSLKEHTRPDTYELIVVDNASTDGSAEWLRSQDGITAIYSETNLGFTAGCNLGINKANPDNDLLILNNDVVLTPNWLENLKICLYSDESIGAVGAASSNVANRQSISADYTDQGGLLRFAISNNVSNPSRWEERLRLIMVCVLVKNEAWQKVGKLDEIFSPGNFEDDDYAIRLRQAGYRLMLCKDSYIHHIGSASFKKEPQKYDMLLTRNREIYREKWGFDAYEFLCTNGVVAQLLRNSGAGEFHEILHIGCRGDSLLLELSQEYPKAVVSGVSYTPELLVGDIAKRLNILTAKQGFIPEEVLCRKYQAIIYYADNTRFKCLCGNLIRLLDVADDNSVIVLRTSEKLSIESPSSPSKLRKKLELFSVTYMSIRNTEYIIIAPVSRAAFTTAEDAAKPKDGGMITASVVVFGKKNERDSISYVENICSCIAGTPVEIIVIDIWKQNLDSLTGDFSIPVKILKAGTNENLSRLYNSAVELCEKGTDICLLEGLPSMHWLDNLKEALHSDKTVGVAFSGVEQNPCSMTSNPQAWKMRTRILRGCVLIKREAFERLGGFDESFVTAEYMIYDISVSVQIAGFKLLECEDSQVSVSKNSADKDSLANDLETFKSKWDFSPKYSNIIRFEIIEYIDRDKDAAIKVLEIGCGCGATLLEIKNRYKNAELFAVELAKTPAKIASQYAETLAADIERTKLNFSSDRFDYIIFADVLEHLIDPWKIVKGFKEYLAPNGAILSSVPNVMHWEVVINLLNGYWDYKDAGILDRTHLRFFTLKSVREMFSAAGFKDISYFGVSFGGDDMADKLEKLINKDLKQQYLAYQYIVKASIDKTGDTRGV